MSEETPLKLVSLKYADDHYKGGVGELSETSTVNCEDGSTPTLKQYVEQHGGEVPVSQKTFEDHVDNEDANAKHLSDDELAQLTKTDGKDLATEEWASGEFAGKSEFNILSGDVDTIESNYVGSVTGDETGVVQVAFTATPGDTGKAVTTAVTVTKATQDNSTKALSGDGLVTGTQAQAAIDKAVETEKTRAEGVEATLTTAVTNADGKAAAAQTAVTNLSGTADTDSATDTDGFVTVELKGTVGDHNLSVSTANIAKADEVSAALNTKQDKLTAGDNIKITDDTISVKVNAPSYIDDVIAEEATESFQVGFAALASKLLQDKPLTKITVEVPATSGVKTGPFYAFLFQTTDDDTSKPTSDPAPDSWGSSIARSKNGVNIAASTASTAEFEFDPVTLDTTKKLIIAFVMQATFSGNKLEGFPCKYIVDNTDNYSGTYYYPQNNHNFWPNHVINTTLTYEGIIEKTLDEVLDTKEDKRVYEKYVVVGVWGQSNAVGYDESPLTKYDIPVDKNRIMQYSDSLKLLTFCAENLQNMNTTSARNPGETSKMAAERVADAYAIDGRTTYTMTKGIHLPLANLICNVIPEDYGVIIVPGARGGVGISNFAPGSNDYNEFKNRLTTALGLHDDNIFGGIVWCQGETDANNGVASATYATNLQSIITSLHNDISVNTKKMPKVSDPRNYWFIYEWPLFYKQKDSTGILPVQKTIVGADNYVEIPDNTPFNTTNYTAGNAPDHFGKDSFRKVIAPLVFEKMNNAGMFQNTESMDAKLLLRKSVVNSLIDKVNEIAASASSVDPMPLIQLDPRDTIYRGIGTSVPELIVTGSSITIAGGGGCGVFPFDSSIRHFEGTIDTCDREKNLVVMVARAAHKMEGVGIFLSNAYVSSNKTIYATRNGCSFNGNTPAGSDASATVYNQITDESSIAGKRLIMDILDDGTVEVKLNGDLILRKTDILTAGYGQAGTDPDFTSFTTPCLGFFCDWSSQSGAGTFKFTDVVVKSKYLI